MALRYSNIYQVRVNNNLGDPGFWNLRLQDIDLRLNALEGSFGKIDTAVQEIIALGIARIDNTYQPLLNNLQIEVNVLAARIEQIVVDVESAQETATVTLSAMLATAQAFVDNIESLGDIDGGTF